jgi:hypothetical protein
VDRRPEEAPAGAVRTAPVDLPAVVVRYVAERMPGEFSRSGAC